MRLRSNRVLDMSVTGDSDPPPNSPTRAHQTSRYETERPRSFDGKPESSVKDFFERFNECCNYNGWTHNKAIQAFPMALRGNAKVFYRSLEKEVKDSMEDLEGAFLEHYDSAERKWQLRSKLYNLRQGSSGLETFITKLDELAQRLEINDHTKLDLFIQGLENKLKNHILIKQPENYEEAVRAAKMKNSLSEDSNVD